MKRRLYLAGPMAGYAEFNHPAFDRAAGELRARGYSVFSPAEHDRDLGIVTNDTGDVSGVDLRKVLGDDLAWIAANAEGIAILPGSFKSNGARAEMTLAHALHLPILPVSEWLELHLKTEPESYMDFWSDYCAATMFGTLPVGMAVPA